MIVLFTILIYFQVSLNKMPKLLQLYANAYKGLTKDTWYLSLVILINRSGTMVIPFMSMYATQKLGFSIAAAGFMMAFFGIGSIIGAFIGGKITDAVGFHYVQRVALLGGGFMFIVVGFLTHYATICAGILVLSIVNESFRPANSAAVAFYSLPQNRTRSYSLNRLAVNLGWACGGAVGGFLASHNYSLLFWVDGLTNIAAAILLVFVLKKPTAAVDKTSHTIVPVAPIIHSAYGDRQYLVFVGLTILFGFCFFQMFSLLPVFLKTRLSINEGEIGILMAVNGLLIVVIEMVLIYNLERRHRPLQFISYGVWLVAVAYLLFYFIEGGFLLALCSVVIITIGEMLSMPFMNTYWLSRSNDNNRGQYAGLYTMAWSSAQIAAPSLGGWIAGTYSFYALFWVLFITAGLAGFGYMHLMRRPLLPA